MTEPTRVPRLVKIGPIEVMALPATEGQATVVAKSAAAARRAGGDSAFIAVDVVFRVVQALLVDPADADRIDTGLIEGTIQVSDLSAVLGLEDDVDEPKPTKARTRRTR